jgi:hypothetical protein
MRKVDIPLSNQKLMEDVKTLDRHVSAVISVHTNSFEEVPTFDGSRAFSG